jgi:uncharacterized protein (DUF1786 family)
MDSSRRRFLRSGVRVGGCRRELMLGALSFEVVFDHGDHGAAPHSMVGHGGRGVVPGV